MPPAGFVHVEMSEEDDDLAMKIELRRKLDCIGLDDIIDDYSDFGMSLDVIDNDLPAKVVYAFFVAMLFSVAMRF